MESIRLSESGKGVQGDSASCRPARRVGWGGVSRLAGGWELLRREGERGGEPMRARDLWGDSLRQRDRRDSLRQRDATPKQQEAAVLSHPRAPRTPPRFVLSYALSKAGTTRVPWGRSPGSRCEFGSSGKNASFLRALAHSPTLRSFRRWSEGSARLEPSCLHPLEREERRAGGSRKGEGRGARREGDAASTPPSGTEQ